MPAYDEVNQSIRIYLARLPPFSVDLIVRTPKQVDRGLREDDWLLREIIEKGKVLYEAPNRTVGAQGRRRSQRGVRHGQANAAAQRPLGGLGVGPSSALSGP